eukprot:13767748-Alexandrium_andersonii.AAC.1
MSAPRAVAKPHRDRRTSSLAQYSEEASGRMRSKRALPKCHATRWKKNSMPRERRRGGQWPRKDQARTTQAQR